MAFESVRSSTRPPVESSQEFAIVRRSRMTEGPIAFFGTNQKKTMTEEEYEKLPGAERKHFRKCPDCREVFDIRRFDDVVSHLVHHYPKQSVFRISNPERLE
jgi:hypothetical protein